MKTINVTIPATISGLWALHPLTPIKSARSYDIASTLCTQLAVRRLSSVQKEYFRELTALVEAYEDEHGLLEKTERELRAIAVETSEAAEPMNIATIMALLEGEIEIYKSRKGGYKPYDLLLKECVYEPERGLSLFGRQRSEYESKSYCNTSFITLCPSSWGLRRKNGRSNSSSSPPDNSFVIIGRGVRGMYAEAAAASSPRQS